VAVDILDAFSVAPNDFWNRVMAEYNAALPPREKRISAIRYASALR
jgi:hypothetical protein